jgi:secreted trypsin-like serine protease
MQKIILSALTLLCAFSLQASPFIYNGLPANDFPGVVELRKPETPQITHCTATLIRPGVLLSAGHCFADKNNYEVVYTSLVVNRVLIKNVMSRIHPKFISQGERNYKYDLAIIEVDAAAFSKALPLVKPLPVATVKPVLKDVVTMVGFGFSSHPTSGDYLGLGIKRMGKNTITSLSDAVIKTISQKSSSQVPDGRNALVCQGDSGGPLISAYGSVIGVASSFTTSNRGTQNEKNFSNYTNLFEASNYEFVTK